MDPHSTRSQFNRRPPKAGPLPSATRYMEPPSKISLEKFAKSASSGKPKAKSPSAGADPSSPLFTSRPIATNSRIKQDEQFKKDMYLAYINKALQDRLNGDSKGFDDLIDQFSPKNLSGNAPVPASQLRLWLVALSHVLSRLERRHAPLVEAIVNMPWTTMDAAFVKSYTMFIGMLLSARPEYLSLVLARIAQGFTHQSGLQAINVADANSSASPITRRVVYDRLHYLLNHLLNLIPTLPNTLQPILVRNFPHKRQPQVAHVTYIRNILRIMEYCAELADRILATIIERAIQVDVEIQVELEELEELEDQQGYGDVFELDPFDTIVGQDASDSDSEDGSDTGDFDDISSDEDDADSDGPELTTDAAHIHAMVGKLDAILKLIFDHFSKIHTAADHPPSPSSSSPPESSPLPPLPSLPDTPITHHSRARTNSVSSTITATPIVATTATVNGHNPDTIIKEADSPRPASPLDAEHSHALRTAQFHTLLGIFDRTILHTFKSRYTQFLLFWYTSLSPEFADLFQGLLVEKALYGASSGAGAGASGAGAGTGTSVPAVTRAVAASYIASFVSRATFVDRDGAREVTGVLCRFLAAHLEWVEATIAAGGEMPGMAHHTVFYAVTQAVFLIFCFRWRDLREDGIEGEGEGESAREEGRRGGTGARWKGSWMPELGIVQRAITSPLNPLKVCSPGVVQQFARVAQATDFIYCYSILEANKRSEYASQQTPTQPQSSSAAHPASQPQPMITTIPGLAFNTSHHHAELNSFFPFDPYKLPRSAPYIASVYREWASVAIDDEDEDEDEDEEGDDEADAGERAHHPSSVDDDDFAAIPGGEPMSLGVSLGVPTINIPGVPLPNGASAHENGDGEGVADGLGESFGGMSISPAGPLKRV
ncbi:RNA polymerase I-specific transcription initiation factor RRN3 [Coniophora puteana RWD-64-598 SS2]|uniref:RNA polymerase I-specific transcription initiation factor RRN3 n=1 Tax=Coniophora puteana (strain RWD-64-598) TaxID=741705 RepID=A0A5M3MAQ5_CONPW|nr:RNA polymerase I-specific transcription initiation factor RRN3 [Coniophora puteana RWD-64-598 SS2]EIW76362.1 RNA polymerase I-specific transcription initiation factor RRN3 [Coniophora puteana RWD-64-598 SS2]